MLIFIITLYAYCIIYIVFREADTIKVSATYLYRHIIWFTRTSQDCYTTIKRFLQYL